MLCCARKISRNSLATFSYEPLHMDRTILTDQPKFAISCAVWTLDAVKKTFQEKLVMMFDYQFYQQIHCFLFSSLVIIFDDQFYQQIHCFLFTSIVMKFDYQFYQQIHSFLFSLLVLIFDLHFYQPIHCFPFSLMKYICSINQYNWIWTKAPWSV